MAKKIYKYLGLNRKSRLIRLMKQQIFAVSLFLVGVVFSVSFNNCMGGAQDTRVFSNLGESFMATNPLVWRPNRLASFTCANYQTNTPSNFYQTFKFPAMMVWQTDTNPGYNVPSDKITADPFQPGLGLSSRARKFLTENNISKAADVTHLLPTGIVPMLYFGKNATNALITDNTSGWDFENGTSSFVDFDEANKLTGSVLSSVATSAVTKKTKNINAMAIHAPFDFRQGTNLIFGWNDPASRLVRSIMTFSIPGSEGGGDEDYVAGEAVIVRFNGDGIEGFENENVVPFTDTITPYHHLGSDIEQTGLDTSFSYAHYWKCDRYMVTSQTAHCARTGDPEADSPIFTGNLAVKGYFGKFENRVPCFAVTDYKGSEKCYNGEYTKTDGSKVQYDPITYAKDKPAKWADWIASSNWWRIAPGQNANYAAWLSVCRRITRKL